MFPSGLRGMYLAVFDLYSTIVDVYSTTEDAKGVLYDVRRVELACVLLDMARVAEECSWLRRVMVPKYIFSPEGCGLPSKFVHGRIIQWVHESAQRMM